MTNEKLTELLRDAANASPQTDLVPAAIRGARRRQAARGVLVAATIAPVIAVAVTLMVANPHQGQNAAPMSTSSLSEAPSTEPSGASPSSVPSSELTKAPTESGAPDPTSEPSGSKITGEQGAFAIPDSLELSKSELSWLKDASSRFDSGTDKNVTQVGGMVCDPGTPSAPDPTTGRWWTYGDKAGLGKAESLDVVVTGWDDGEGALQDLAKNKARCVGKKFEVLSSNNYRLVAKFKNGITKRQSFLVVRRLNNVLIAVTYSPDAGKAPMAKADQAVRASELVLKQAEAAGLGEK